MSSYNRRGCFKCGGPFGGLFCRQCTCVQCRGNYMDEVCSICCVKAGNSFVNDPQPQMYSCELCGNDAHYGYDCPPQVPLIKDYRNERIDIRYRRECEIKIDELKEKFNGMSININKKKELRQLEQATNVSTHTPEPSQRFKIIYDYDDDDDDYEESTIPLNEIVSQIPPSIAITPVLPTLEPEDSLIIGNEELSIIPEKELDEVIKSSVENLFPIPSESEDTSESDSDCDLPSCDDFSPINVYEEKSMTFSNPLFDSNDDFTSSDDESLSDEDVLEDNVKIYSNPLFEFDDEYISSDVNPLFDEVLENIENIGDDYYDSEGDIIYLGSLFIKDTTPNLPPKEFLDYEPRSLKDEPDNDDLMTEDKVFDPGIHEKKFSLTYESLPFKDRHYLSLTYVIQNFLPYFIYPVEFTFLLSSKSKDTIFDPGISAFHFSSLEPVASHRSRTFMCFNVYPNILNESPIEICSSTCFEPNITMISGEIAPDFEDSHARSFVYRSLDLQSLACLFMGIRYPNLID
ncbi:hypothetical protein Tco_0414537 [Tanacetum coccineum]